MSRKSAIVSLIGGAAFAILIFFLYCQAFAVQLEKDIQAAVDGYVMERSAREEIIYDMLSVADKYEDYTSETVESILSTEGLHSQIAVEDANMVVKVIAGEHEEILIDPKFIELSDQLFQTEMNAHGHVLNYGQKVGKYNKHVRGFPSGFVLVLMGYEKQTYVEPYKLEKEI